MFISPEWGGEGLKSGDRQTYVASPAEGLGVHRFEKPPIREVQQVCRTIWYNDFPQE